MKTRETFWWNVFPWYLFFLTFHCKTENLKKKIPTCTLTNVGIFQVSKTHKSISLIFQPAILKAPLIFLVKFLHHEKNIFNGKLFHPWKNVHFVKDDPEKLCRWWTMGSNFYLLLYRIAHSSPVFDKRYHDHRWHFTRFLKTFRLKMMGSSDKKNVFFEYFGVFGKSPFLRYFKCFFFTFSGMTNC